MARRIYRIEVRNFDPSGEKFRSIHRVGSDEFKFLWIAANEGAVKGASPFVCYYDPAVKEMISNITLKILQTLKARKFI